MKARILQQRLLQLEQQSHTALLSYRQARVLFADEDEHTMYQSLRRHTKNGILTNVCKGVWLNPLSRYAHSDTRLEELALLLRVDHYSYVSLETVLSQASIISQQMFAYLTVMTTGPSKVFKTPFGTLEFNHTKRSPLEICRHQTPENHRLPWASVAVAWRDLKRVGRNLDMVDTEALQSYLVSTNDGLETKLEPMK